MSLLRELLRRRRRGLTLSRNLMCYEAELSWWPAASTSVVTAWMGIGLPWGVSKIMRHYVESGKVALEEWSHLALGLRFRAGAMGVPFLPSLTMLGSDLMAVGGIEDPRGPLHRRHPGRGARALPGRGAPARASRRPLRQLPDRRLPAHGRRHRPRGDHGAGDGRGDHPRGGDAAASGPHGHPGLRGRRARARAVRLVSPRVLRALRGRRRALRRVRRGARGARGRRRRRVSAALCLRAGQWRRLPGPVRRRAAGAPAARRPAS